MDKADETARIIGVRFNPFNETIEFLLEGEKLPVTKRPEIGEEPPLINLQFSRDRQPTFDDGITAKFTA